jgi:hypothetical protein
MVDVNRKESRPAVQYFSYHTNVGQGQFFIEAGDFNRLERVSNSRPNNSMEPILNARKNLGVSLKDRYNLRIRLFEKTNKVG